MIITTTPTIDGQIIKEYNGVVFSEVVVGINFMKDMSAGLRNIFGGRSTTYEKELRQAQAEALNELEQRARQIGANAIVGMRVDYEVLGVDNGMMMVIGSGTAVTI
ncbi:heavy metal-binding domain-containing protein [Tuanshanicoccus lijuaniae]|uniref:heavy metal-binding domain-containing protein n=1 Tax=Aerococcaceae bacterium zg-1292 TaxID=2774330 RepID=UPI001BD8348F|nr:heavy metal-binding domain-containing protein [Aerococcaceae bacterium zg-BR9]MBF6978574.1 heavy metal-binding domain-containing protein [Aerococcaceae bacterium zg-BR22]MBS4455554.1 heavy metal-binding domain-containing protein [Aerococcaceae bacterium zg-A91]MBS4457173.1 heavy metal-binding domain-containing protein [Aerococcaceae bacterium zg-BR33]